MSRGSAEQVSLQKRNNCCGHVFRDSYTVRLYVKQVKRALSVFGAPHQVYAIDNSREDYGRAAETVAGQPFSYRRRRIQKYFLDRVASYKAVRLESETCPTAGPNYNSLTYDVGFIELFAGWAGDTGGRGT